MVEALNPEGYKLKREDVASQMKPLGCFYCKITSKPLDWVRDIKQYVCEECSKKYRWS